MYELADFPTGTPSGFCCTNSITTITLKNSWSNKSGTTSNFVIFHKKHMKCQTGTTISNLYNKSTSTSITSIAVISSVT